ncbi:unnamed protein product [Boreogadus saida]
MLLRLVAVGRCPLVRVQTRQTGVERGASPRERGLLSQSVISVQLGGELRCCTMENKEEEDPGLLPPWGIRRRLSAATLVGNTIT